MKYEDWILYEVERQMSDALGADKSPTAESTAAQTAVNEREEALLRAFLQLLAEDENLQEDVQRWLAVLNAKLGE